MQVPALDICVRPRWEPPEREFFIDNLLVRIHFVIVTIRWTGLAPWEFEFPHMQVPALDFCVRPRWEPLKDHLGVCTSYRIQIQVLSQLLDPLGSGV